MQERGQGGGLHKEKAVLPHRAPPARTQLARVGPRPELLHHEQERKRISELLPRR